METNNSFTKGIQHGEFFYEVSRNYEPMCFVALIAAMEQKRRIKIVYKDDSILHCRVGRSTGDLKLLLAIKTKRSFGGEAILVGFIKEIVDSKSKKTIWKV